MKEEVKLDDKKKISLQRASELQKWAMPFVNYKKQENAV